MENAYVPARALQHSSTKELDYKYCAAAGWIVFSSAYKPIDGSGTPLEAVQGEATGVGGSISLKETLQQLVKEHVNSPPPLRIYDEIPEKPTDGRREAVRPELLFELRLREKDYQRFCNANGSFYQTVKSGGTPFRCQNCLLTGRLEKFPYVMMPNPYRQPSRLQKIYLIQ